MERERERPEMEATRFNPKNIQSCIEAAKQMVKDQPLYVCNVRPGFAIESRPPLGARRSAVQVNPDGTVQAWTSEHGVIEGPQTA